MNEDNLKQNNSLQETFTEYQKVLTVDPNNGEIITKIGEIYQQQQNYSLALSTYQKAIALQPNYLLAYYRLAQLQRSFGNWQEAESTLILANKVSPSSSETHFLLGCLYLQWGNIDGAIASFTQAVNFNENFTDAYYHLAISLTKRGDEKEINLAIKTLEKVIEIDENYMLAYASLAGLWEGIDQEKSLQFYEKALNLKPSALNIFLRWQHLKMRAWHWQDYQEIINQLERKIESYFSQNDAHKIVIEPWITLAFPLSTNLQKKFANYRGKQVLNNIAPLKIQFPPATIPPGNQIIKIGYISPDFGFHPVGVLVNQIFQYHNRSEFEIYCYSLVNLEDEYRNKIKGSCDYFFDVSSLDNLQVAEKIREDGINILIDLAGYTTYNRSEILALQPAPIQIQYLGYPGTMAADFLPYMVADQHLIPPHLANNYTEKIIYLPHGWVTSPVDFPRHTVSRIDYGLPATGLVFCNFNSSYKLNPDVFRVWMNILKSVPRSVLWLADAGEKAQTRLLKYAEELGISKERIIFAPRLPYEQYLARYQVADLILDTFPYNGGATTVDGLWAGVPILTLSGESYVSRMGYSLCQGVGLTELICHSLAEYEEKAISIGNNPAQLIPLKRKLAVARQQSDLFKPQVFVSHLETALKNLYHSLSPQEILVNESISAANTDNTITNVPISGSSFFEQGKYHRQQGNLTEAVKAFQRAIALTPNFIEAFHQLGLIYQGLENWEGAKNIYERALEIEEENPLTLANVAIVYQKLKVEEKAIFYYQRALSIRPDFYQVYHNLSQLYLKNNQYILAENLLMFALQVCPTWAEIHFLLGNLYADLGERNKAINSYQSAIANNSDLLKAYYPLGALLLDGGNALELELAEKVLKTAISKDMNYSEAYFALGILCEYGERKEEAMTYYQQAFNLQPLATNILYRLAHLKLQICQWDNYEKEVNNLISYTERELSQDSNTILEPLTLSAFPLPLLLQKEVAHRRSEQIKNLVKPYQGQISPISLKPKSPRIKVGYVSPDFRCHGVSTLIYRMFEYHSRPEFEVFAYSLFPTIEDEFQQIIRQNCDHYRDVSQLLPVAIAQQIQRDEISILIDLGGYTRHSKPQIFALQPAPIQIHYLGFPSTMGADFLPYIIADEILIPPSLQSGYSEKVIYLPQGWMVFPIEIKEKPLTRQDYGLPESGFIYGNFNTSYKLNPPIFKLWMEILVQVPESVLWLNSVDGMGNERLRKFAQSQGVNPERLIFARRLPYQQHLARCQMVDLFLDTFPYNGGATTADILRAGVPILTCYGDSYVSRMGASLCYAMGLDELVCDSFSAYQQSAIALGKNPMEIVKLKEKILKAKRESPLFQPQIFMTNWETMLREFGVRS